MQGKKNLAANASNNTVHLDDRGIGMLLKELLKITEGAPDSACFINFHDTWRAGTKLEFADSGHVEISGR